MMRPLLDPLIPKNWPPGCEFSQVLGADVEGTCGEGFVDRDVDAADPRTVHPGVADQAAAGVDNGDVHRLGEFTGLVLTGRDDAAGVLQRDALHGPGRSGPFSSCAAPPGAG